jgi:hypothetical protein
MPTGIPVTSTVTIGDIPPVCQSVGAHLAAKLQCFASDERTLTDELCDMICIWFSAPRVAPASGPVFQLHLQKTTTSVEVKFGADLELIISSPLGAKRCLLQAKVLDPVTLKLRCNSHAGWRKLRKQLQKARAAAGSLAFLLVYVPGGLLDGAEHGYGTYEQGFLGAQKNTKPSFWGATVIACDDLLRANGRWKAKSKVPHDSTGNFVDGIPFWQFVLELLLCRRGTWMELASAPEKAAVHPFMRLSVKADGIEADNWRMLQRMADEWLPPRNPRGD